LNSYLAELHVHTVLSPCAGVEMIPPLIVQTAIAQKINLIAITDHNASSNVASVMKAAQGETLTVLPGMELQTKEEVHVLCIFDTLEQLAGLQNLVNQTLPDVPNNIEYFGEQFVVDHTGDFIRRKEQLLINSTKLSIEEAEDAVHNLEGLFIPAHVDRQAFGLFYRLGFIPPGLKVDALEISRHTTPKKCIQKYPQIKEFPLIQSGDVHFLADFMGVNQFNLHQPTIPEIRNALNSENGCSVEIITPI